MESRRKGPIDERSRDVIVAAAIRTANGTVWSVPRPGRHDEVLEAIATSIGYVINSDGDPEAEERWWELMRPHVMGFVADDGVFLDRREAFRHAKECGQKLVIETEGPGMASENLW